MKFEKYMWAIKHFSTIYGQHVKFRAAAPLLQRLLLLFLLQPSYITWVLKTRLIEKKTPENSVSAKLSEIARQFQKSKS